MGEELAGNLSLSWISPLPGRNLRGRRGSTSGYDPEDPSAVSSLSYVASPPPKFCAQVLILGFMAYRIKPLLYRVVMLRPDADHAAMLSAAESMPTEFIR
jgi:hypothetical protein